MLSMKRKSIPNDSIDSETSNTKHAKSKTELKQEKKARKQKRVQRSMGQEIRWDKLDNTANLFPVIAGENMSNVYRISVTLTELIDPDCLQEALDIVLPKFDGFNLRLQRGVFWYYFEEKRQSRTQSTGGKHLSLPLYPSKQK